MRSIFGRRIRGRRLHGRSIFGGGSSHSGKPGDSTTPTPPSGSTGLVYSAAGNSMYFMLLLW